MNRRNKPRGLLVAFVDSLWLDLSVAIVSAFLSLQVESEPSGFFNQFINTCIFAIGGGSIPFLIKLYIKLGQAFPAITMLREVVDDFKKIEDRLLPSFYVTETMKSFHQQWINWRSSLNQRGDIDELEKTAWTLLAGAYLREESKKIASKYVFTNTNRYTILVAEASRHLERYHLENRIHKQRKLIRYHITGMLPEEFYNGSQIEFTANSSQPIFFCHKWEDYEEFYNSDYRGLNRKVKVRRCIVVRQSDLRREEIGALSTLTDLKEQAQLSIIPRERQVIDDLANEIDSVQQRLFRKCSPEQQKQYKNYIGSILGRQNYRYWPIARTNECVGDIHQWANLLDVFSNTFHGDKPNDASYCALNESSWHAILNNQLLRDCFKPGWIPEIVLFGELGNGYEPEDWYFGILGHWRPFTPDIELRFLTKPQVQQLYFLFTRRVYQGSKYNGNLLSLLSLK